MSGPKKKKGIDMETKRKRITKELRVPRVGLKGVKVAPIKFNKQALRKLLG